MGLLICFLHRAVDFLDVCVGSGGVKGSQEHIRKRRIQQQVVLELLHPGNEPGKILEKLEKETVFLKKRKD